jgi:DNA-binding transcriptional regulator YiaG
MPDKPFPRRCTQCHLREVILAEIPYDARIKHDGHLYCFHISALHVNRCGNCGFVVFDSTTDEELSQGLRSELHLLSPTDIRKQLERFGWSQKDFADHLGTTPESVSRWLTGARIQSRVMDKGMRNLFELESMRQLQHAHPIDVAVAAGQEEYSLDTRPNAQ